MVPKQQVLYILAGQTDAAGAVEISHAMLAEVVAVCRKQGDRDSVDGCSRHSVESLG